MEHSANQKRKARSLAPREHGATVEIAFPLVTGFALGGITLPGLLFGMAFVAAFLAHEPVVVLLGQRGARALAEAGARARRILLLLVLIASIAIALALASAPGAARALALVPAVLAVVPAILVRLRRAKTAAGELLVVMAFSATLLPIATSGHATPAIAFVAASVFWGGFSTVTLAVRAIRYSSEPGRARRIELALAATTSLLSGGLALSEAISPLAAAALLPFAVLVGVLAALGAGTRHLRIIGFSVIGAGGVAMALILVAFR